MITIHIDEIEYFDGEFHTFPEKTVNFEYSLSAIARWEAKWKIPFLSSQLPDNDIRTFDFYRCMATDHDLSIEYITEEVAVKLKTYVDTPQTATTFNVQNGDTPRGKSKVYTAEEVYALMFMNGVPLEFEDRNLNMLFVVLKIISVYSNPPKKMSQEEIKKQNTELNALRKKQYNTRG